ncbi:alpha/beta fold hydrolase [Pyxidicoccus xibeiensis]|uniref:alpha/beta fold hydrolase n=1 Tax=Pyxidicoccus xibeiensis TaxID=2906759 RepID=UPI0020A7503E|nr:alpha/beta hydrolase [Pyxidicoccus xibeiensis]MCP3136603.1 alpha/beta hydrolase [Pyxidicoccus xibeiensis]
MRTLVLLGALLLAACAAKTPGSGAAPSGAVHQVRRVTVADGVELEVLDFGGHGPALVFLAGMGNTGHVFDELAPRFTSHRRVWALTRRGFGASSWPEQGYDTATLGRDVVRALDALGIEKAALAGHSIAGTELTWVGLHSPQRVEKLIYLDAAYARVELKELLKDLPSPPAPEPQPEETLSRAAVSDAVARAVGGRFPEEEIEQGNVFDATTGQYLGPRVWPGAMRQFREGEASLDFSALRVPVLSLYVAYEGSKGEEAFTGVELMPPADQEKVRAVFPRLRELLFQPQEVLRKLPGSKVVGLEGAEHYLWLSHPERVVRELKDFLGP